MREGAVTVGYFKTYQGQQEPPQTARHFVNLFEAPTLFYVACVTVMVVPRIRAYALSWLVLLALWVWIVITVASGSRFVFSGG